MVKIYLSTIIGLLMSSSIAIGQGTIEALDETITAQLKEWSIPGTQIVLMKKDRVIWSKNYGVKNIETQEKVTDSTQFRIGSISKTFTAVAAMQLIEKGKWSLQTPIKTIIPNAPLNNLYPDSPIQLVHLLEHTSGLDDIHLREYAVDCPTCTIEEGLNYFNQPKSTRWTAGVHHSYSNNSPLFVAYGIEQLTNQSFEKYIQQHIFQPLNMRYADYFLTKSVQKKIAIGYDGYGNLKAERYEHTLDRPSGSINCSALELSEFLGCLLNDGQWKNEVILAPNSVRTLETVESTLAAKAGFQKGYGKFLETILYKSQEWIGHGGAMMGFSASMYYNKEAEVGYVILLNKANGADAIESTIRDFLVPQKKLLPSSDKMELEPHFLGYYNSATARIQMVRFAEYLKPFKKVYVLSDTLYVKGFMEEPRALQPLKPNVFLHQNQSGYGTAYVFVTHDKIPYLQLPMYAENLIQTASWNAWARIILPILTLIFFVGFLMVSLIHSIRHLIKRQFILDKSMLFLSISILCFALMFWFFMTGLMLNPIEEMGRPTIWSIDYLVTNLIYIISCSLAIYFCFESKQTGFIKRLKLMMVGFGLIAFMFLFSFDLLGLMTWLY